MDNESELEIGHFNFDRTEKHYVPNNKSKYVLIIIAGALIFITTTFFICIIVLFCQFRTNNTDFTELNEVIKNLQSIKNVNKTVDYTKFDDLVEYMQRILNVNKAIASGVIEDTRKYRSNLESKDCDDSDRPKNDFIECLREKNRLHETYNTSFNYVLTNGSYLSFIYAKGQLFKLEEDRINGSVQFDLQFCGPDALAHLYNYQIELSDGSGRTLTFTGTCGVYDLLKLTYSIVLNSTVITQFTKNGRLTYNLIIL